MSTQADTSYSITIDEVERMQHAATMKWLGLIFTSLFLLGAVLLGVGFFSKSPDGDAGRPEAAAGVLLVAISVVGWGLQLAIAGVDRLLRRRRPRP